jgi:transcriptional regulator with XRE-family HTH domain
MTALPDYAVNLRRLFAWHLQTNKDVAELLGAAEHSVSGWTRGTREPGAKYLRAIGDLYEVNPSKLFGDPDVFGSEIANPKRCEHAAQNIATARRARLRGL